MTCVPLQKPSQEVICANREPLLCLVTWCTVGFSTSTSGTSGFPSSPDWSVLVFYPNFYSSWSSSVCISSSPRLCLFASAAGFTSICNSFFSAGRQHKAYVPNRTSRPQLTGLRCFPKCSIRQTQPHTQPHCLSVTGVFQKQELLGAALLTMSALMVLYCEWTKLCTKWSEWWMQCF